MNKINQILEIVREANGFTIPKDLPLPVKYDGIRYYWGKDGEMVADFDEGVNVGDGFRIRGWGRIQNEESQDECAKWIAEAINAYGSVYPHHLLVAIDMSGDTRYESTVIKGDTITVSLPNGHATHFIDEENDTLGTNYDWAEFSLKIKEPLEPQLQASSELVETLYKLLVK
jgi:hypothetical protein